MVCQMWEKEQGVKIGSGGGVVAIKSSVVRMNLTEVTFGRRLRRQEAATSMSGRRASHGQKVGEGVPQRTSGHRVAEEVCEAQGQIR